jgi:hypothetical protein
MKKIVWTFGLISGGIIAGLMLLTLPFEEKIGDLGLVVGYTTMLLAFLMIYFGIRTYRDNELGGDPLRPRLSGGDSHRADLVDVLRGDVGSSLEHGDDGLRREVFGADHGEDEAERRNRSAGGGEAGRDGEVRRGVHEPLRERGVYLSRGLPGWIARDARLCRGAEPKKIGGAGGAGVAVGTALGRGQRRLGCTRIFFRGSP